MVQIISLSLRIRFVLALRSKIMDMCGLYSQALNKLILQRLQILESFREFLPLIL